MSPLFIILLYCFGFGATNLDHEFHLSKSILNYDTEEKSIQISLHIFIDDLELALKQDGFDSLRICTLKEKESADQLIYDYVLDHFRLKVNGSSVIPEFLGKEGSDDLSAVWCYLEVYNISKISTLSVNNTILTQIFKDQKNITSIQLDKKRMKDFIFTSTKTEEEVQF